MNQTWERIGTVLGRFLLSLIFLGAGFGTISDFRQTEKYMTDHGMPGDLVPYLLVAAIAVEIIGALMVITGFWTRFGAVLLIIFLLAVTPIFHAFWSIPVDSLAKANAQQRQNEMNHFMKNLSMVGGLLILVARGGGPCSFDNLRRGKIQSAPTTPSK